MADKPDGEVKIDTGLETSGFLKGIERIKAAMASLKSKLNGVGAGVRESIAGEGSIFAPLADKLDALKRKAREAKDETSGVSDTAREAEAETSAAAAEAGDNAAEAARTAGEAVEEAAENAAEVMERVREQSSEAPIDPGRGADALHELSAEYAEVARQADSAERRLARMYERQELMRQLGVNEQSMQWRRLAMEIENTEAELASCEEEMSQMRMNGTAYLEPAIEQTERAAEATDQAREKTHALQKAVSGIAKVLTVIGKTASKVWSAIRKGASTAAHGVRTLLSPFRAANDGATGLVRKLTSIKTMLASRIKRAFISQIISAFTEGTKALVQYNGAFDAAMSNMKNRFAELGANVSVSFSNLVLAVEPIITRVIDAVSAAVTKLNALIAQLKGESTVIVAARQTASYADSLRGQTDAAKNAADAQKKLNATLGTYDEIHKLNDNTDTTASTAETGASAGAETFTTVPVESLLGDIPDSVKDVFDRVKEAISAQDWYGAGAAIGAGLNVIIGAADASIIRLQQLAPGWAATVADGLNGLTAAVNFAGIGQTLADGLNLIFSTANAFITRYDWAQLGQQISEDINGFVENFDWEGAGTTIGNGIQGILTLLITTIENTNWYALGQGLMAGVSGIFNAIRWGEIGSGLAAAFNGVVDFLAGAIERADFTGAAENLATAVNNFFAEADFKEAGETFGDAIKKILMGVATWLEDVEWDKVGEDLAEFVKGIDWDGVGDAFWEAIGAAIGAAIETLWSFFTTLTEDISTKLEEKFEEMDTGSIGGDIILGILDGIVDALVGIGDWIGQHIFYPLVDGIKKVFGIASPAKEMKPLGDNIAAGLLEGIKNAWSNITGFFRDKLTAIKTTLSNAWATVKTTASTKWGEIKGAISEKFGALDFSGKLGTIKSTISDAWDSVKTSASTKWGEIKETVSSKFDKLKTTLTGGNLETAGKGLINTFASGVYTNFNLLRSTVSQKMQGLKDTVSGFSLKTVGENLISGFKQGITDKWEKIKSSVTDVFSGLVGTVKGIFDVHSPSKVFEEIGANLDAGLENGITGQQRSLLRTAAGLAGAVTAEVQSGLSDAQSGLRGEASINTVSTTTIKADALGDRLTAIAERLAAIADAFRGIELALPAPAVGAVIPARTRIPDTDANAQKGTAEDGDIKRMLGQLIELLTAQATADKRVQITVPVQLDRRQIGGAVAEYNLSGARLTNGGVR